MHKNEGCSDTTVLLAEFKFFDYSLNSEFII